MTRPTKLSISGAHYAALKAHLFPGDGKEAAALALCGVRHGANRIAISVRDLHVIPYAVCTRREPDAISWPVEWMDGLVDQAESERLAVVKFHSHTGNFRRFSRADDKSDTALFAGIHALVDYPLPHASVVMMDDGSMFGRTVGPEGEFHPIDMIALAGDDIRFCWHRPALVPDGRVGRDTSAFGRAMTADMSRLAVAVVGCSGTGSIVIEQLGRLGIGRLVLVDPEGIETKNLNRVVNATRDDADRGLSKVAVAARAIAAMGLGTVVECYASNLVDRAAIEAIAGCDVLFGCVDSAEGRDVLNRVSSYYLLPYIDSGVRIRALPDGRIDQIDGVIHYIRPGGSSLLSREAYRVTQVAADALRRRNPELYAERQKEKYILGAEEEAPAVISINMTSSAMAVNELLGRVYQTRHQPNRDYAITRINLAEMEIEVLAEGAPCPVFAPAVGAGDIIPMLDLPELSA